MIWPSRSKIPPFWRLRRTIECLLWVKLRPSAPLGAKSVMRRSTDIQVRWSPIYVGISDEDLDALLQPIWRAEDELLTAPANTFTDVERKLAVISNWGGDHIIEANLVDDILADVRRLNGRPMAA